MRFYTLLFFSMVTIGLLHGQDRFERLYPAADFGHLATSMAANGDGYILLSLVIDDDGRYNQINVTALNNKGNIDWSNVYEYEDTVRIKELGEIIISDAGTIVFSATLAQDSLNKMVTSIDGSGNVLWTALTGAHTDVLTMASSKPSLILNPERNFISATQIDPVSPDILLSAIDYDGKLTWQKRLSAAENTSEQIEDMLMTIDSNFMLLGSTTDNDHPLFITKMDTAGNFVWSRSFSHPDYLISPEGLRMIEMGDSSLMVIGSFIAEGSFTNRAFIMNVDKRGNYRYARSIISTSPTIDLYAIDLVGIEGGHVALGLKQRDRATNQLNGLVARYDLDTVFLYQSALDSLTSDMLYRGQILTVDGSSASFLTSVLHPNGNLAPYLSKVDNQGKTFCAEDILTLEADSIGFLQDTLSWTIDSIGTIDSIEVKYAAYGGYSVPILSLQDTTYCPQDPVRYIVDASVQGAELYMWDDGSTDSIRLFTEAGMYMVTVSVRQDLCFQLCDTVTIMVTDLPMVAIGVNPAQYCTTGQMFLLADGAGQITDYLWSTGSTDRVIAVTGPGTYSVTVTDICGNTEQSSKTLTEADFDITLNIGVSVTDENICIDNTITLTAAVDDPTGLVWSTGETNVSSISVSSPGDYTVMRAGEFCDELGAAQVTPGLFIAPIEAEIVPNCNNGTSFQLSVQGTGFFAQQWSTGTSTRTIIITNPDVYRVTLTDGCGDTVDREIEITRDQINQCIPPVVGESCLRWPNTFLPEGDNTNNKTFGPESTCDVVENYELHIFNRWGQEIFTSTRVGDRWDGRKDGDFVPGDVYFYWASFSDGSQELLDEGDVTVLR